jgi:pSer/pThr/pTyr-binding forkhead associated (FHA) protein
MKTQLTDKRLSTQTLPRPVNAFRSPYDSSLPTKQRRVTAVRFHLEHNSSIDIPARAYIMLGRQKNNQDTVDVDLGDAGEKQGVSRNHAVIQVINHMVTVRDYNSRNGTLLNGEKLYPMRDYPLQSGDELTLGCVTVKVQFV